MLASGQMGFDIRKDFIRRKDPTTKPRSTKSYTPVVSPSDSIREERPPEDYFKNVKNKLLLNQSAMLPQPENQSGKQSEKQGLASQKLDDLAGKSDTVLLKVSTVWPFTFFRNDIIIDPYKVNIIFREFFWSEHIHSVMVKDILDVVVETSIFFATIRIVDQGYIENTIDIVYLKRDDAMKVRKIIQGLVIAHRQAVDLSILKSSNIRDKAEELGQVKGIDDLTTAPNLAS